MTINDHIAEHQARLDAHRKQFVPIDDYIRSHRCSQCHAAPWEPCDLRRARFGQKFHCRRIDRGIAHYYRDVGRAPWPEERDPGRKYSSISYPDSVPAEFGPWND